MANAARAACVAALFAIGLASARAEDDAPTHLRGAIVAIDGTKLTVRESDGTKTIVGLMPDAKVLVARRASLADVSTGNWVGVATIGPNGLQEALEVHIFPDALRGRNEGQSRWDLGRHSRMIAGMAGAKTVSYDGQNLVVTTKDSESSIQVRPNTPVVKLTPGSAADLKPGTTIFVRDGERQPDGSVAVDSLVVGADGVAPPM